MILGDWVHLSPANNIVINFVVALIVRLITNVLLTGHIGGAFALFMMLREAHYDSNPVANTKSKTE